MFYAAKAAITLEGEDVSKHSAVISAFGRRFVKTARVPTHLHRLLLKAFRERQSADYNPDWMSAPQDVERRLAAAEEFVAQVRSAITAD